MFVKYGPNYYNTDLIYQVILDEYSAPHNYYVRILFVNNETAVEDFVTKEDAENFAFKLTQAK